MRGWFRGLLFASILAAIWAVASSLGNSPLLPSPLAVGRSLVHATRDGTLGRAIGTSVLRLSFGYGVSLVAGVALGVGLARSLAAKQAFGPLVLGLSSVPSICWLPLAILWFGLSETAIQVVVILGAMLPIAVATEGAVRQVNPLVVRAARTMGARGPRLLFSVVVPAAFPGIVSGAKLGWTFALRSLMAGELLFVSGGLGQLLETGRDIGDTTLVLAVIVSIVALGRASEWLLFARLDREIARRWGTEAA
ncbi:MAG: ABC transporter permease [Myxococcales bacterium]|nr:ABC transporter permease [Myxococcales bacterium]